MLNSEKYISKAFTLAEVLIVLAVIGVVAAMTMPMLTSNYQKTQQVTALRKVYSQLSEAIERNMNDENVEKFTETTLINGANPDPNKFFKTYFKVSKYCNDDWKSCFPDKVSNLNKNQGEPFEFHTPYCVITKDGMSLCIYVPTENDPPPPTVTIDTNGKNLPNVNGRDIWSFSIYHDGSVDNINPEMLFGGGSGVRTGDIINCKTKTSLYGNNCLSIIIDAGWKMDY